MSLPRSIDLAFHTSLVNMYLKIIIIIITLKSFIIADANCIFLNKNEIIIFLITNSKSVIFIVIPKEIFFMDFAEKANIHNAFLLKKKK